MQLYCTKFAVTNSVSLTDGVTDSVHQFRILQSPRTTAAAAEMSTVSIDAVAGGSAGMWHYAQVTAVQCVSVTLCDSYSVLETIP
jgi:hypothetical protein